MIRTAFVPFLFSGRPKGAVSQRMKRAKQEGVEALKHSPLPVLRRASAKNNGRSYPSFWHQEHLLSWLEGSGWMPQALSSRAEEAPLVVAQRISWQIEP